MPDDPKPQEKKPNPIAEAIRFLLRSHGEPIDKKSAEIHLENIKGE